MLGAGALKVTDGKSDDSYAKDRNDAYDNLNMLKGSNKFEPLDVIRSKTSGFPDLAKDKYLPSFNDHETRKKLLDIYKIGPRVSDALNLKLPQSYSTLDLQLRAYESTFEKEGVQTDLPKFKPKAVRFKLKLSPSSEAQTPEVMQYKASQKLLNLPNNPLCLFSSEIKSVYESKPRPPQSVVSTTCAGPLIRFNQLEEVSAFPNVTEKEVILARGKGEFKLDFTNEHVKRQIDNLHICNEHRNELSAKWELKKYPHCMTRRIRTKGEDTVLPVCSLPAPYGANHCNQNDRPFTCRHKVSLEEAACFLETNGILIHAGIPVCNECSQYLKSLLPNGNNENQGKLNEDFDDVNMGSADETGSNKDVDMNDARAAKVKAIAALRNYSEQESSQTTKPAEPSSEIGDLIRISVPTERKPFEDLKDDTKQRKVQILQSFQEVIARQLAPDNPTALIELANSKNQQSKESPGEKRLKNLMSMIKAQYYVAESDRERIAVLSQIALEIPLEELKKVIPGLTKYQWKTARRQAREHLEVWKPKVEKQIRVKYDRASIDVFLEFITSSAVMAGLPFGTKVGKLPDGRRFDIPSTLRKQDDAEIIRMFEHYVKEKELNVTISHTVMRNILKVCPAIRMKAMECVDYYEATGKNAFEKIANRMDKLCTMNLVDGEWQKEVQQELQETKLYLRTDYRLHIAEKSQVAEHCMNHALSDSHNCEFRSSSCQTDTDFPHTHNAKCDRCLVFPQTMKKIYEKIAELMDGEEKTKGDHEKLEEIKEELEIYENDILEWKKHVMRSAYSEKCRLQIIDELKEGEALITCDYSMKWIPRHYRETQKDFYGKKGLSWHITHILAKKDGKLVQHTVVHNLGFEEQDSNAVAAIVTDVLKKCKSWGINGVVLRSDNAGYYRNAALISSIPNISEKTGVTVKAYTFSEPQAGKGPSDREGARIKWRMICALNNQYNITTSEEMFLAMTYGQKRLEGITVVTATVSGDKKEGSTSIPGISFLSHVEYSAEDKSFTFWKHYGIGQGKKMKVEKAALNNELLINSTTSETPLDNEYVFWRNTGSVVEKQKKKQKKNNADAKQIQKEGDDDEEESSEEETTYKMFRCTEPNCIKKYVHYGNLCNHIESGKHKYKPLRKTLYDYALTKFGEHLDDLKERNLQLYARQTIQDCVSSNNATVSEGWGTTYQRKE
uniref:C2H2-type domain-containing protein n=1 Tax=Panagrolaimus davidi TaxID=227884 RepID=A0A914PXG5_9BILA